MYFCRRNAKLPGWKSLTQRRWHGPMIWKDMLENELSDIASWQTKSGAVVQSFKSLVGWSSIQTGRTWISWWIITRLLTSCIEMFVFGTKWKTRHSVVGQQTCKTNYKMDSGSQVTSDKIVLRATMLRIVDGFFFKTQTLLETLRTQHLPLVSHTYIFGSRTFVSIRWMCKKQTSVSHSSTESEIIAGLRTDGLLALDLRDIVIKVLRSSKNTPRHEKPTQGNFVLDRKSNSSTEMRKREFEHLSNVDYVPTNTHSSQGESQLHIFEDNEAVIKMIVKGRSPTRRHVSRTHRVALDWLFDRIRRANQRIFFSWRLESSSSFVQLHEFLDVLLQPFWQFLSDPIRKQSAMSKRGQVATSGEGSPMAKPKPTVPANARPINSVLVSPWSARENPSQYLGCPVNPRTDVEGQGDLTRTRKYVQTLKIHKSNVLKWNDRRMLTFHILGNSSIRKKLRTLLAQGSLCRQQLQQRNFKIWSSRTISTRQISSIFCKRSWELQKHTQRSQWQHWRQMYWYGECLWLHRWEPPFILDRIIWWTWRSTRPRTSTKFRAYSTSHKTWYWSILKRFWMCIRLTVHLPHGQNRYCLTIKWSSGQRQKDVSTQIPFYAWRSRMEAKVQLKDGKVAWRNSKCHLFSKNRWELMEKILSSTWVFSKDFSSLQILLTLLRWYVWTARRGIRSQCAPLSLSLSLQNIPGRIARVEHRTWEIHRLDHLHVNVQRHRLDKKKETMEFVLRIQKMSRNTRRDLARTLDVSGSLWYGTLPYTPEGKWDSTANQMVERFKDTGLPVFKSIRALSRGILKKKNGRDTTLHFNADASNTELLFQIIHSESQPSFYGTVTIWCEQNGMTEEKGTREAQIIRDHRWINVCEITRSTTFGISSKTSIWIQLEVIQFTRVCELALFKHSVSAGRKYKARLDEDDSSWAVDSIMPRMHTFSSSPTI